LVVKNDQLITLTPRLITSNVTHPSAPTAIAAAAIARA